MNDMRSRFSFDRIAATTLETLAWVGLATAVVAILDSVATPAGLGSLYLIAVLAVAIRRGQMAALAAAVLGVLILNYFFIQPLHQLTIADSDNVVALGVLLLAALVVGRLAGQSRLRAAEAELRAEQAAAREREAVMLADAATALLGGTDDLVTAISAGLETAGRGELRLGASSAPDPQDGEISLRLPTDARPVWLYAAASASWTEADLNRIATPLARLLDVAAERENAAARSAEAEAARQADAAKTVILHAVSHDLRSPLTAVRTAAAGLREEGTTDEDRVALIDAIEDESDRLTRLIGNLLDLSRIEAGAVHPLTDWCDLLDVISGTVSHIRDPLSSGRIQIELEGELPLVRADASQLDRVFSNLIENGLRFSPPDQPVRITGGVGAGKVTVRVVDRGPGVPGSQRSAIFEPFHSAGGDRRDGVGLGLAISKGFVEANGGELRLQGDSADGTAFAVSFPLVEQPAGVG
ncbi:MAG: two-component system, OmpR family, sensor histidine kinase KdpD [Solirubrobacterales bacterium]|jgi:two-component system sensor histidine kinase KdpD|nr:two-component system, OmpR family, sensor histidine kinase KdpD [Solirubrobacterales bacterium]